MRILIAALLALLALSCVLARDKDRCQDLTAYQRHGCGEFGPVGLAFHGFGMVNGECSAMYGCTKPPHGVELFKSQLDCDLGCFPPREGDADPEHVDPVSHDQPTQPETSNAEKPIPRECQNRDEYIGSGCDDGKIGMALLGYAMIGDKCQALTGCMPPGGVYLHKTMEECQYVCRGYDQCQDHRKFDHFGCDKPGIGLALLGYHVVDGQCQGLTGCMPPPQAYLHRSMESCKQTCEPRYYEPVTDEDKKCDDMARWVGYGCHHEPKFKSMGYGMIGGQCRVVMACSALPHDVIPLLHESLEQCKAECEALPPSGSGSGSEHHTQELGHHGHRHRQKDPRCRSIADEYQQEQETSCGDMAIQDLGWGMQNGECTIISGCRPPHELFATAQECRHTCPAHATLWDTWIAHVTFWVAIAALLLLLVLWSRSKARQTREQRGHRQGPAMRYHGGYAQVPTSDMPAIVPLPA